MFKFILMLCTALTLTACGEAKAKTTKTSYKSKTSYKAYSRTPVKVSTKTPVKVVKVNKTKTKSYSSVEYDYYPYQDCSLVRQGFNKVYRCIDRD